MSDKVKDSAKQARKAKNRRDIFGWITMAAFVTLIVLLVCAAVAPPPWEVHDSMFRLADKILAGMGICSGLQALRYGRDATVAIGSMKIALDGDGDGKTKEIE